jgi:shikimate kinase
MNLVLIGYRGTGKSLIGRILENRLRMPCISMDEEINKRAGMSIPEIVEKYGWNRFRDIESEVALGLSARDNVIVDTGGGVIERPDRYYCFANTVRYRATCLDCREDIYRRSGGCSGAKKSSVQDCCAVRNRYG